MDNKVLDSVEKSISSLGRSSVIPMPTVQTSPILGNNECLEPHVSKIETRREPVCENNLVHNGTNDETKDHPEKQYLELVREILEYGNPKSDRTGTGTLSVFGRFMRFDLNQGFPLFTTKRVFWRGIVEELLWFLSGSTDANKLKEKGVHIWDGNTTKEFLKNRGLEHYDEGDIGPGYGFQWKYATATYHGMRFDYRGKGVDQISKVIDMIKNDQDSRRIICSSWNVSDIDKMALPPCHCLFQFYVNDGYLSCCMYQRSCDMGLGMKRISHLIFVS